MAFLPRALEVFPLKSPRRPITDHPYDNPRDHMPQWRREAQRAMRDFEEVRDHCRRQIEMIAAQREFLKGLNPTQSLAPDKGTASEGIRMRPEEDVSVGE